MNFKAFWLFLSRLGVRQEYELSQKLRIILVNQASIIAFTFSLFFSVNFYLAMPQNYAWVAQSCYALFLFNLYFNHKGWHKLSVMFFIVSASSIEFVLCSILGYQSGEHLNYFTICYGAYIISGTKNYAGTISVILFPAVCLVVLFYTHFSLWKDPSIPLGFTADNYKFALISNLVFSTWLGYIFNQNFKAQQKEITETQLELRRVQEREEQEKNRLIVENAIDAVIAIDSLGRIIEWNPQSEKIFGYTRDEVLNRGLTEIIVPPSYRERHLQGMAHFLATGKARVINRRIEISAINKAGEEFPIELSITQLRSKNGTSFSAFIRDLREMKKAEEEIRRKEELINQTNKALSQLQIDLLRSQVNPHFYFNTLNNLYGLALNKSEKTPEVILTLSGIMEYVIYDCNADKVPLEKEINFLKNYIEIEKLRYFDTAHIEFETFGNLGKLEIAPLILIQFVENAFKHGLQKTAADGWIKVKIVIERHILSFTITNSRTEPTTYHEGIGLNNARNRLSILYNERHGLVIDNQKGTFSVNLILEL